MNKEINKMWEQGFRSCWIQNLTTGDKVLVDGKLATLTSKTLMASNQYKLCYREVGTIHYLYAHDRLWIK